MFIGPTFASGPWMYSIISGQDPVILRQWLLDAQNAMQSLMIGGRPVSVSYGEKSVTYTQASMGTLAQWIYLLQRALGLVPPRRAITPIFY
jgi:hypothetical protein